MWWDYVVYDRPCDCTEFHYTAFYHHLRHCQGHCQYLHSLLHIHAAALPTHLPPVPAQPLLPLLSRHFLVPAAFSSGVANAILSSHRGTAYLFFLFVCFSRKTQIKINMKTKLEHNCSLRVHIALLAYFVLSWSGSWEIRGSWDLRFPIILFGLQSCFLTRLRKMEWKGVYREERPRDTNLPSVDFN